MPRGKMFESIHAKCPYYKHERKAKLYCEGVQGESSIHLAFSTIQQRESYEKQFCEGMWHKCMIADAHNRKWDYQGE